MLLHRRRLFAALQRPDSQLHQVLLQIILGFKRELERFRSMHAQGPA